MPKKVLEADFLPTLLFRRILNIHITIFLSNAMINVAPTLKTTVGTNLISRRHHIYNCPFSFF